MYAIIVDTSASLYPTIIILSLSKLPSIYSATCFPDENGYLKSKYEATDEPTRESDKITIRKVFKNILFWLPLYLIKYLPSLLLILEIHKHAIRNINRNPNWRIAPPMPKIGNANIQIDPKTYKKIVLLFIINTGIIIKIKENMNV